MFGYSMLFRNRWMALIWAAGICWSAYQLTPEPADKSKPADRTDATGATYNDADVAALRSAMNGM